MARCRFYVITVLLCCSVLVGHTQEIPAAQLNPVTILVSDTKTSEIPVTSSPIVESNNITKSADDKLVTTEKSETETVSATDLDKKKTTTTSTSTSTTTSTTSTTTSTTSTTTPKPPPSPKPAPGPVPSPEQGTWSFSANKTSNVSCIIVQFAAQLNVTYSTNTTNLTNAIINVPANATVTDGSCGVNGSSQWLVISWPGPAPADVNATARMNNMTLVFHGDAAAKTYDLHNMNLTLTPESLPNSTFVVVPEMWHNKSEWQTGVLTSYSCAASSVQLSAERANVVANITLTHLQVEAFRTATGNKFNAARDCGSSDVPDAVPIAVGCALGGLVLVVLVAYLVGRRRSAARGYLSM